MEECSMYSSCQNADKMCFTCFDLKKYKPLKEVKRYTPKVKKSDKPGMAFEEKIKDKYNEKLRYVRDHAYRQFNSGALANKPGDVITTEPITAAVMECKERGTLTSSGEKQIQIKLDWLIKLKDEARELNKDFYFLPFKFKGYDEDYVALPYDILLNYVEEIQRLHELLLLEQQKNGDKNK